MQRKQFIAALATFAAEGGLEVSGIQNMPLAIALWITAGGLMVWAFWPRIKVIRSGSQQREAQEPISISDSLTQMHKRMMQLQKTRLSRKINIQHFESVLPTLLSRLGLIPLEQWVATERHIKKRVRRAIGRQPKDRGRAYFKALSEAAKIKKEWLSQSRNWEMRDGIQIGEWLDSYGWGISELRNKDKEWQQAYESVKPHLKDDVLRDLIAMHIDFSYTIISVGILISYSRRRRNSMSLSMLHETLVGAPISPIEIDKALSKILRDIDKRVAELEQKEKLPRKPSVSHPLAVIGITTNNYGHIGRSWGLIIQNTNSDVATECTGQLCMIVFADPVGITLASWPMNQPLQWESLPVGSSKSIDIRTSSKEVLQIANYDKITQTRRNKLHLAYYLSEEYREQHYLPLHNYPGGNNYLIIICVSAYNRSAIYAVCYMTNRPLGSQMFLLGTNNTEPSLDDCHQMLTSHKEEIEKRLTLRVYHEKEKDCHDY